MKNNITRYTLYRAKNTGNTIFHLGIGSKKYHPIAHEKYAIAEYLDMAVSTGHFLLSELNIAKDDDYENCSQSPYRRDIA